MDMALMLKELATIPDCHLYPPSGLPVIKDNEVLPADLRQFYELCGGADLFVGTKHSTYIVPPDRFVPANPAILIGVSREELSDPDYTFSNSWYILVDNESGEYITIDLNPNKLGYCYDSFWDIHPFNSTIIASSFTDLLVHLISDQGNQYHRDDWEPIGDAFPSVQLKDSRLQAL